jgi:hypothetical protein
MDKWAHLGHTLGECWNDPTKNITFVNIPKNASSFIKGCLIGTNQFTHSSKLITANRYLIALREPIDRWVSGIAQFTNNPINQHLTVHELVRQIKFDDHTERQTYFLQGVDLDRCEFIKVDNNLYTNLKQWLIENGYTINIDTVTSTNKGIEEIKNNFATLIDKNIQIKLKLTDYYKQDYELFNRVKFYGTR